MNIKETLQFGFDATSFDSLNKEQISSVQRDILHSGPVQIGDINITRLSSLSIKTIAALTFVESAAFGQPMGESLVSAWENQKNNFVAIKANEKGIGFALVDEQLASLGIYYLDLIAVSSTETGIGTELMTASLSNIRLLSKADETIVFGRTQNPAAATIIRKALHKNDIACFPIDRDLTQNEQRAIETWLAHRDFRILSTDKPTINFEKGIFYKSYINWKPHPPQSISEGPFKTYLNREHIDFPQFVAEGNAFMVGGTIYKTKINILTI